MKLELYEELAEKLKALSHSKRLMVLCCLLNYGECNVTMLQKMVKIPQPTLSQHLTRMQVAGILSRRKHGTEVYYSIGDPTMRDLMNAACPHALSQEDMMTGQACAK
jgi:ArsR family transcriptional regulator